MKASYYQYVLRAQQQVYLDVEALARELKELAAGADGNEALQALREKVLKASLRL
jgi:hypothetical protein